MQVENAASLAGRALDSGREEDASAGKKSGKHIGITTAMTIPDLFKQNHRLTYQIQGRHNDEMLSLITELNNRLQAQCIGLAYEAFEVFLKDFAVELFFCTRATWSLKQRKAFHKAKKEFAKANVRNTKEYFTEYVNYLAVYNSEKLLDELREMLPDTSKTGEQNWFGNVFALHKMISVIRHLTVHRGGEVGHQSLRKLGGNEKLIIEQVTQKSAITKRPTILPTVTLTAHLIEALTALAHVFYRTAGKELGMNTFL
jgi:hypothetical protein